MKINDLFDTNDIAAQAKTIVKYNIALNRMFRLYKKLYAEYMELKRKDEEARLSDRA